MRFLKLLCDFLARFVAESAILKQVPKLFGVKLVGEIGVLALQRNHDLSYHGYIGCQAKCDQVLGKLGKGDVASEVLVPNLEDLIGHFGLMHRLDGGKATFLAQLDPLLDLTHLYLALVEDEILVR